jgi:hypothetical protein
VIKYFLQVTLKVIRKMTEKKTIEISEEVFNKIAEDKGKSTWDQQLERLYEMAYGTEVRAPKLQEFGDDEPGGVVGKVRAPSEGKLEFILRMPDGTPTGKFVFDRLAPNEEVTVELSEGEIVEQD